MRERAGVEELRRRVQLNPASIAFAALAEAYRRAGAVEDAIATCRTGLKRHPAYISARVTLGRALFEAGRTDEARAELETALALAPENLAAIRALAEIHEQDERAASSSPPSASLREQSDRAAHVRATDADGPALTAAVPTPQAPPVDAQLQALGTLLAGIARCRDSQGAARRA